MITREELQGQWNQVKGQARQRWSQLSDNDFQNAKGNTEQLVGMIQEKTGESKKEIEAFLDSFAKKSSDYLQSAMEGASDYAQQARDQMQKQYQQVSGSVEEGYAQANQMVRSRPMESVSVAFGAGIVAGVLVGLMLYPRR